MKTAGAFVRVLVDGDKQRRLLDDYGVSGYPTLLFLDPEGREVGRLASRDPREVVKQLAAVIDTHRFEVKGEPRELKRAELDECWSAMERDVATAYKAMGALYGARASDYLLARLLPVEAGDRVRTLIETLDKDDLDAREAAARELRELGASAEPALRAALATADGERKAQIEAVLAAFESSEKVRRGRALVVLERLEARDVLEALAKRGVKEARAALDRLKKK